MHKHKHGLCCHAVSVCVSVTFVSCVKTNKDIFEIFSPPGSQAILVFRCQTGWRYSDGNPLTGASNAGGVGKKRDSGRISGFAAYRSKVLLTVLVANCEKQSRDGRRQASSTHRGVRRTRQGLSVCDGLDVIHRRGDNPSPGQNPPGHNPRFLLP